MSTTSMTTSSSHSGSTSSAGTTAAGSTTAIGNGSARNPFPGTPPTGSVPPISIGPSRFPAPGAASASVPFHAAGNRTGKGSGQPCRPPCPCPETDGRHGLYSLTRPGLTLAKTTPETSSAPNFSWTDREAGMATAEYAIATLAAVAFAGLLAVILGGDEVRGMLVSLIRSALTLG